MRRLVLTQYLGWGGNGKTQNGSKNAHLPAIISSLKPGQGHYWNKCPRKGGQWGVVRLSAGRSNMPSPGFQESLENWMRFFSQSPHTGSCISPHPIFASVPPSVPPFPQTSTVARAGISSVFTLQAARRCQPSLLILLTFGRGEWVEEGEVLRQVFWTVYWSCPCGLGCLLEVMSLLSGQPTQTAFPILCELWKHAEKSTKTTRPNPSFCPEPVFDINRRETLSTTLLPGKESRNVYYNMPVVLKADFGFFLFSIAYRAKPKGVFSIQRKLCVKMPFNG